jgi:hypothetical protein
MIEPRDAGRLAKKAHLPSHCCPYGFASPSRAQWKAGYAAEPTHPVNELSQLALLLKRNGIDPQYFAMHLAGRFPLVFKTETILMSGKRAVGALKGQDIQRFKEYLNEA